MWNDLLWILDSLDSSATLFQGAVNKVSPNRTILAGENVGIAWLLLKQPGVDWYGFLFPAFLWLWLLQVWACLCCSSCYAKSSFVKSTWLHRAHSQSCALAPAASVLHSPREVSEVLHRCHKPTCVHQMAGAGLWLAEGSSCAAALKPGLSGMICKQQQAQQSGLFQLGLVSLQFGVNFNVT